MQKRTRHKAAWLHAFMLKRKRQGGTRCGRILCRQRAFPFSNIYQPIFTDPYRKMSNSRHVHFYGRSHRCKHCGKREREHSLENRRLCPMCGLEVARTGLYPHMKYHCKANPKRKKRSYSTRACPICKKNVHSSSFARHVKTHSKKKK